MRKILRTLLMALLAVSILLPASVRAEHLSLPDGELEAYGARIEKLPLITNDGMTMSYGEAVEEICGRAEALVQKIRPSSTPQSLEAMKTLIRRRLWLQQYGCDLRMIGDHGIRHIYGNIGRSLHFLEARDDTAKLTALVAQVYHDIGYTDPDILYGVPGEGGEILYASKSDHDLRSWDFFLEKDLAFWQGLGVFSEKDLTVMEKAVALHNCSLENYAERMGMDQLTEEEEAAAEVLLRECRDVNVDAVVAAVHLGDKLALSEREKMAMTAASTPEIVGYFTRAYGVEMMKKVLDDEVYGDFSRRFRNMTKKAAQEGPGRGFFRAEAFGERDVTPESGKRSIPMHFIQTDGDCLTLEEKDGVFFAHVVLKALDYDEGVTLLGEPWASRQFLKFFRDVGIPKEEAPDYVRRAFAGPVELSDMHLIVEIRKESLGAGDERRSTRQAIVRAVEDSPVCRWGIAYRKIRAKCKAGDVSDPVIQEMEALLGEIDPPRERLDAFRAEAAAEPEARDAKALRKAFDKCLKQSALQEVVEALWQDEAREEAA